MKRLFLALFAIILVLNTGCDKNSVVADTFAYTIDGVYVGMPAEKALNMLGAPSKALTEDYVRPGVRIQFSENKVYCVLGQILSDEKGVMLRASVDGPKTIVKKLGQPVEVINNTHPHSYFKQVFVYSKGEQYLVIPINAKTGKIWALRMQSHAQGYRDMLEN